jgi:hypothetical protein
LPGSSAVKPITSWRLSSSFDLGTSESGVAAALCHRSPNWISSVLIL